MWLDVSLQLKKTSSELINIELASIHDKGSEKWHIAVARDISLY